MNDWKDYMPADALVTAEDARAFVASFGNNAYTGDVLREMDAKMARDRRRACRRGALDSWRAVRDFVTWARDDPSWWGAPVLARAIEDTIAFRAEARRP